MKVFVIDDEKEFARKLGRALKAEGHEILIYTKPEQGKMSVKEAQRHLSQFKPEVIFCDIRWDRLDEGGWEFAAAYAESSTQNKARLIMMLNVGEEFGNKHYVLKAHTFEAEFITHTKLMADPATVLASTPGLKAMVIDDKSEPGIALANQFRVAGFVSIYCDPTDLIEDDVLRQISQFAPHLIVCDTHWSDQCDGEGLSIMAKLAGQQEFILTSDDPKDPESLMQAAQQHHASFLNRATGSEFIVGHGKRLLEQANRTKPS